MDRVSNTVRLKSLYIDCEAIKFTNLEVYFTKRLNALVARYIHWFWDYVAPLHPNVSCTVVCYKFMNFFIELKRVLQKMKIL